MICYVIFSVMIVIREKSLLLCCCSVVLLNISIDASHASTISYLFSLCVKRLISVSSLASLLSCLLSVSSELSCLLLHVFASISLSRTCSSVSAILVDNLSLVFARGFIAESISWQHVIQSPVIVQFEVVAPVKCDLHLNRNCTHPVRRHHNNHV